MPRWIEARNGILLPPECTRSVTNCAEVREARASRAVSAVGQAAEQYHAPTSANQQIHPELERDRI